jgi:FMN-dependent oxidoreductase (nitrilotriacetate monooxygenase family)
MALVGFLQAQNCTNLPSSWRHPESRDDSMSADYYQEIARILEAGKFHMAFFDDRLAMPDRYGSDHAHTVEYGIRCVKMDPIVVLTTMGMVTEKLGLASTCSTTYFEPFDVARRFATLDLMTGGRAAWNVVTSVNDGEAHNMGKEQHLEHDLRYDRADEFMEVVLGHWDSWEDGSLIIDKKSGRFADPTKVKRLDHNGAFFKSRGPFTVPRSSQGHPVVIQAGASGRGQRFAGRWGEVIFTAARNLANARQGYDAIRNEAAKVGRDPDQMFLCNLITPVSGATKAEAEDKMALIGKLPLEIDALSLLAEGLNFDFATKGIDEPLTTEELQGMQGMLGIRDGVLRTSGKTNPSTRDPGRHRRRAEGDRRPAGRDVYRPRLRRLCDCGDLRARLLRGFRQAYRAGTAAPRAVPQGLCRQDVARESRLAAARGRRMENPAASRGRIRTRGT